MNKLDELNRAIERAQVAFAEYSMYAEVEVPIGEDTYALSWSRVHGTTWGLFYFRMGPGRTRVPLAEASGHVRAVLAMHLPALHARLVREYARTQKTVDTALATLAAWEAMRTEPVGVEK